ncbi:hypothetical protein ES707_05430 [subsurface metagenome]
MTNDSKELIPIQSKELVKEALDFCQSIAEIVIMTEDEYVNNCEVTKKVTNYSKDIDKKRKELLEPLKKQKAIINDYFNGVLNPIENLREKLRNSLTDYTEKQKQKRLEVKRRADAEAEKERQRLAAQAKRDKEKARKAAEEGKTKKAEAFQERSAVRQEMAEKVKPVEIPKEVPKVAGISYRTDWSAKVVDIEKFIAYCLQYKKFEYLEINMSLLNKHATDFKDTIKLPGIEFCSTQVQVTR